MIGRYLKGWKGSLTSLFDRNCRTRTAGPWVFTMLLVVGMCWYVSAGRGVSCLGCSLWVTGARSGTS